LFIVKAPPRGRSQQRQQEQQLTLQVVLDVPRLVGMPDVSLEVSKTCLLRFEVPGLYRLQMQLPFTVAGNASVAKFSKRKRQLSVFLPLRLEEGRLQTRLTSDQEQEHLICQPQQHLADTTSCGHSRWQANLFRRLSENNAPNRTQNCGQGDIPSQNNLLVLSRVN
jgi:hypothetical protein